jgi:hypothetical protein
MVSFSNAWKFTASHNRQRKITCFCEAWYPTQITSNYLVESDAVTQSWSTAIQRAFFTCKRVGSVDKQGSRSYRMWKKLQRIYIKLPQSPRILCKRIYVSCITRVCKYRSSHRVYAGHELSGLGTFVNILRSC